MEIEIQIKNQIKDILNCKNIDDAIKKLKNIHKEIIKEAKEKEKQNKEPKKYDNKTYYEHFKAKNADKINDKIECPDCLCLYTYFSKSRHMKSKKHLYLKDKLLKEKTQNNIINE